MIKRWHLVAIILALVVVILASAGLAWAQGRTTEVGVYWDEYVYVETDDPDAWELIVTYELRQGDVVVDLRTAVSDCRPAEVPGQGQCGSSVEAVWDAKNLQPGMYDVWVRLMWTDGTEQLFVPHDPPTQEDEEHFWWKEQMVVQRIFYVPVMFR